MTLGAIVLYLPFFSFNFQIVNYTISSLWIRYTNKSNTYSHGPVLLKLLTLVISKSF